VVPLLGNQAQASTVTANAIIDLNTAIRGNTWTGFAHPLVNPVLVTTGDTVNINIGFLPGQALTSNGNGFFNPWLMLTGFPSGPIPNGKLGRSLGPI
jgi:hypothetical protein